MEMFQPEHFKVIAEELPCLKYKNKNIADAVIRTTIGRYYYYIFLKYRETIFDTISVEIGIDVYKERNIHVLIQKTMTYYDRPDIAGKLSELKLLRNKCDYKLTLNIDKCVINDAKLIVFYLEREITSIKAGAQLNNAFIKALKEI
ncbi:MAG: hypothetical protein HQK98_07085 [Nitrospirae bacterium]|nr:hypothetical protein [Nitrospirota bacterium]